MKVSKNQDLLKNKKVYQPWANGFISKGKIVYHPYTEVGFKFQKN